MTEVDFMFDEPSALRDCYKRGVFRRKRKLGARQLYNDIFKYDSDPHTRLIIAENEYETKHLPLIIQNMDVFMYGIPLWYFIVDQLTTKDRPTLWKILEFMFFEFFVCFFCFILAQNCWVTPSNFASGHW